MRLFIASFALALLAVTAIAQDKAPVNAPQTPRKVYGPDPEAKASTIASALKALKDINIGELHDTSEGDFRTFSELLKQWVEFANIEQKRRSNQRSVPFKGKQ